MEGEEESLFIISNLMELIEPYMLCDKSRIISTKYSRLDSPQGSNGQPMLKIELSLLNNSTGENWVLSLVAKTLPENKENKNLVYIKNGFKNEIGIYMVAKPALEIYLREKDIKNGADFFAMPFGGRINLTGADNVDHNAVLVLQNYKNLGFNALSRQTGLNLETSKMFLTTLAKLHGTFLGLKFLKPLEFSEKVKPFLNNISTMEDLEDTARRHMVEVLSENESSTEIIEKAVIIFNRRSVKEAKEPWATFVHNNMWVENILVKHDRHRNSKCVKILDFTKCEYNSPLRDLLFFLFTSVELGILKLHLDDLLDCYYYCLISIMKILDIEEKELFCRLAFNRELKLAASQSEFYRIVCLLYQVLDTKHSNINSMENDINTLQDALHKRRLYYIVNEFNNKGWLDV